MKGFIATLLSSIPEIKIKKFKKTNSPHIFL